MLTSQSVNETFFDQRYKENLYPDNEASKIENNKNWRSFNQTPDRKFMYI